MTTARPAHLFLPDQNSARNVNTIRRDGRAAVYWPNSPLVCCPAALNTAEVLTVENWTLLNAL